MFEMVWMTTLGFAMPAIGASGDILVDSGYERMRRTCRFDNPKRLVELTHRLLFLNVW